MTIAIFAGGERGATGPTGPPNDRDINSMIMLAWAGSNSIVKGYDLYTNNFSTGDGIDPSSTAIYNSAGYYQSSPTQASYQMSGSIDSTSKLFRVDKKGAIRRWVQDYNDCGHFEGKTQLLTSGVAVTNKGGTPNLVGLACANHNYSTGKFIEIRGMTNYSGTFTVDASSTTNEIVVASAYTAETIGGSATVNQRITLGTGNDNPLVQPGLSVEFPNFQKYIFSITGSGYRYAETQLSDTVGTTPVTGVYAITVENNEVHPAYYYSTTASGWNRVFNSGPDCRAMHGMVYDPTSSGLWMFGGYTYGTSTYTNELWFYSTVSGQWTKMSPPSSPTIRQGPAVFYSPPDQSVYVFGGYNGSYLNDMWKYSVPSGIWMQVNTTGSTPTGRYNTFNTYVPASGTMLMYGGDTGSANSELWEFTVATSKWLQRTYVGSPGTRYGGQSAFQTVSGAWFVLGSYLSDATLWRYDYNNNSWKQMTSSPNFFGRGQMFYNDADDNIYALYGLLVNSYYYTQNFYRYRCSSNAWDTSLAITPGGPTNGTGYFAGAWDSTNRLFYHHGGENVYRASLWQFNPATLVWRDLYPEPRRYDTTAYAPDKDKLFITNGTNYAYNNYIYDLWSFDCGSTAPFLPDRFTKYYPTSWPSTNWTGMIKVVYSPNLNCLFRFGGRQMDNTLWKFDLNTQSWIALYPQGVAPITRYSYQIAYVPDNDVFYLYGAYNVSPTDFFKYDAIANTWTKLPFSSYVPHMGYNYASDCGMCYDSINKCLWMFLGILNNVTYFNTLWKFNIASCTWTQIFYRGTTPTTRSQSMLEFDPVTQSLLLFGGYSNGSATQVNDLYIYDIRSNTMYLVTDPMIANNSILGHGYMNNKSGFSYVSGDLWSFGGNSSVSLHNNEIIKYNLWDRVTVSGITSVTTSGLGINTNGWSALTNFDLSTEYLGTSDIYAALSFDNYASFSIVDSATLSWKQVTRNNSGVWQYRDQGGVWQTSPANDPNSAYYYALTYSGNQMNAAQLSALSAQKFADTGGFVAGTTQSLELSLGFNTVIPYIPTLKSYSLNYTTNASNMTLVTEKWDASAINPTFGLCLVKVSSSSTVSVTDDISIWISMDNGQNYDLLTNISWLDSAQTTIKAYNTSLTPRNDNRMKMKVITNNYKSIAIDAIGVAVRYQ